MGEKGRRHAVRFLARFLDDSTVRDVTIDKDKFILCAAEKYPKIEVRDFAALQLASILQIKVAEDPKRTPEQWSKLREQVKKAVEEEAHNKAK
jgi:hypothetical protein